MKHNPTDFTYYKRDDQNRRLKMLYGTHRNATINAKKFIPEVWIAI